MKNLKKFAALLLAGAMALLMLTACGGGGSVNNPEEQKVLNHIRNQKGVQVTSDAQLREVAEKHLREDLEGALQLGNHKFFTKVHVEGEQEEYLTVTVTMNYIYSDTLLSSLLDAISKHVNTDINANVNQKGTWSKVGVVILSNSQQSYIGLSIRVKLAEKGIASAKVVLTGFVVVFAMLILLIFIIKIYGAIIQKAQNAGKKSKEKKAETVAETPAPVVAAPVAPAQTDGVSDEVVAVISAAVATMYGSSEKARIKSIKKSSDGGRSAWAKAGVLDNTRPF